ncbi:MAG: hypothetical protein KBG28_15155 [Kofleriaceae bacterium]|nr:hypothetical protein [Kofleriaceae bacterium]
MIEVDPYLSYSFRPFRIGFCCENPSAADIYEMASLNCTLWGGTYNPIIDVSNIDEARMLVRQYGCDLLYAFHASSQAVTGFVSSFPELSWMDFKQALYDTDDDVNVPVFFDLMSCCMNFIRMPDAVNTLRVPPEHPAFPFLALAFGTLPTPSSRLPIDYVALMAQSAHPVVDLVGEALPEPSVLVLSELVRRGIRHLPIRRETGVVVGDTADPVTLRSYWNLRAAGFRATLFDPSKPEAFVPWVKAELERIQAVGGASDYQLWLTSDLSEVPTALRDTLSSLNGSLVLSTTQKAFSPTLSSYLSRIHGLDSRTALPHVRVSGSRPLFQFIPDMPKRRWRSSIAGHFMLELRSSTHTDQPRSLSFRLPYMPDANQLFARTVGILSKDQVRTQIDGFGIISDQSQRTVGVRGGFGDELVSNMFGAIEIEAALSDAGRYTDRLVRHMGGLQKCRAFKIPGVRELIHETAGNGAITAPYATQRIRGAVAGQAADLDRFDDLVLRAGQRRPLTGAMVWDYLLRKRVFLPGSELKCEECSLTFWVSIDDLRSTVTCTYCGAGLVTGPLLKSNLDWKYRRSPLFSVDESLRGSVSVLLTLLQIHACLFSHVVAWTTSMDLVFSDGTRCETDFAVATANTLEPSCLVIGECKTNSEFNQNDITNLVRVRNHFHDAEVDVYIVFAKLAKFTDAELKLIRDQPPEARSKIVLFDAEALESEEPFRATKVMILDMARLARASAAHFAY